MRPYRWTALLLIPALLSADLSAAGHTWEARGNRSAIHPAYSPFVFEALTGAPPNFIDYPLNSGKIFVDRLLGNPKSPMPAKTRDTAINRVKLLEAFERRVSDDGLFRATPSARGTPLDDAAYLRFAEGLREVSMQSPLALRVRTMTALEAVITHGRLGTAALGQIALALGAMTSYRMDLAEDSTYAAAKSLLSRYPNSQPGTGNVQKGALETIAAIAPILSTPQSYWALNHLEPFLANSAVAEAAGELIAATLRGEEIILPNLILRALENAFEPDSMAPDSARGLAAALYAVSEVQSSQLSPALSAKLETLLQSENQIPDTLLSATNIIRTLNHVNPPATGSLSELIAELPKPVKVAHTWPHYWIYANKHFQLATRHESPVQMFAIALAAHRLLAQYRPDIDLAEHPLVSRAVDFVMAKRAALEERIVFGEGVSVINLFHTDMARSLKGLESYQNFRHVKSIASFANQSGKDDALTRIEKSSGQLTIYFDGHGGRNHLWLEDGKPGSETSNKMRRPGAISYVEMADALQIFGRTTDLGKVTILLDCCFSYNFAVNLLNEISNRKMTNLPVIFAASNFDSFSYQGNKKTNNSIFFQGLEAVGNVSPIRFRHLFQVDEFGFGRQHAVPFMPTSPSEIEQLFGPGTKPKLLLEIPDIRVKPLAIPAGASAVETTVQRYVRILTPYSVALGSLVLGFIQLKHVLETPAHEPSFSAPNTINASGMLEFPSFLAKNPALMGFLGLGIILLGTVAMVISWIYLMTKLRRLMVRHWQIPMERWQARHGSDRMDYVKELADSENAFDRRVERIVRNLWNRLSGGLRSRPTAEGVGLMGQLAADLKSGRAISRENPEELPWKADRRMRIYDLLSRHDLHAFVEYYVTAHKNALVLEMTSSSFNHTMLFQAVYTKRDWAALDGYLRAVGGEEARIRVININEEGHPDNVTHLFTIRLQIEPEIDQVVPPAGRQAA